jgi:flagellar assembly factor FliW
MRLKPIVASILLKALFSQLSLPVINPASFFKAYLILLRLTNDNRLKLTGKSLEKG